MSCGGCMNCIAVGVELGSGLEGKSKKPQCYLSWSNDGPVSNYYSCHKSCNRREKAWMQVCLKEKMEAIAILFK